MTTFGLVHGAWQGAWCWEALAVELERSGHRVVAVDLPCDDPDADCAAYAKVVADALAGEEQPVVVGHSLGGLTIPLVANLRPVRQLVYLCALVPRPERSPFERTEDEPPIFVPGFGAPARDELDRSYWPGDTALEGLYPDCPPSVTRAALERLRRQASAPSRGHCLLAALPDMPAATIIGVHDAAVSPEWSRWTARHRLGIEPIEIEAGHWPMLTRPAELAALLDRLSG